MTTNLLSLLNELGFAEYEARAYVALLERSPLNGYELARHSGVPRANIYGVLEKLEARGAILRQETSNGTRYAPLPPQELLARLGDRMRTTLDEAAQALAGVGAPPPSDEVWNVRGYAAVLDHARTQISAATRELLLAVWPQEAALLGEQVAQARQRAVAVNTLCLAGCPHECGHCQGHVHRYALAPREASRWLIVIPDRHEVLAGEIHPPQVAAGGLDGADAVRTRQRLLVNLTGDFIRHVMALGALLVERGPALENELRPETREALSAIGPATATGGWLGHLRELLVQGTSPEARS